MFETCMVESAGQLSSKNRKWTAAGALALESVLIAFAVVAAMLHTEAIPANAGIMHLTPPYAPPRAVVNVISTERQGGGSTSGRDAVTIPSTMPTHAQTIVDQSGGLRPDLPTSIEGGVNPTGGIDNVLRESAHPPMVRMDPPKRVRVSAGVQSASLLQKITPAYPQTAKQAGISGAVVLRAIIAKDGSIENLQVLSGHPMLTQTALDAVRQWRYRPTYLGDEPVEVETTITVNFTLSDR